MEKKKHADELQPVQKEGKKNHNMREQYESTVALGSSPEVTHPVSMYDCFNFILQESRN